MHATHSAAHITPTLRISLCRTCILNPPQPYGDGAETSLGLCQLGQLGPRELPCGGIDNDPELQERLW